MRIRTSPRGGGAMSRLGVAALLAAGLVGAGVHGAHADTSQVVSVCDQSHLQAAVDAVPAGSASTITFSCSGTIALSGPYLYDFAIVNQRSITLDGHNAVTLDGQVNIVPFFVQSGSTLTLNNITVANGYDHAGLVSTSGGAIHNLGTLVTNHAVFLNNTSNDAGGAILDYGTATATINNSTFNGNEVFCSLSGYGGGAIADLASGVLTVSGSTFRNNYANGPAIGGAILGVANRLIPGNISVTNSTFTSNTMHDPNGIFVGSGGTSHLGAIGGGAIGTLGDQLSVSQSTFSSNSGDYAGGAILFHGTWGPSPVQSLSLDGASFARNTATPAGADTSSYKVAGMGGALATATGPATINYGQFVGNVAQATDTASQGGAILALSPITMTHSELNINQATNGGGILASFSPVTLSYDSLGANTVGNCAVQQGGSIVDAGNNYEALGTHTCGFGSGGVSS